MNGTRRRDFLRTMGAGMAAAALPRGAWAQAPAEKRPNVVVIMADDMGYSDLGCFGGEVETPNLDRLASNGLRFTQFYNCARCCPSRAALLTGLYPHQAGVGDMLQDWKLPGYGPALNDRCVTLAEVMRGAGYATAMSGKWHVGQAEGHWPCDRGFDHYFGLLSGGCSYFEVSPGRLWAKDNAPITPAAPFYSTDLFTDSAVGFVDQMGRGDKPFFLYLAYTAPHFPVNALTGDIAKYRGRYDDGPRAVAKRRWKRQVELGIVNPAWSYHPDQLVPAENTFVAKVRTEKDAAPRPCTGPAEAMEMYAAQIDRMDQGIGRVVGKLAELGALDNTLILFLSDNGGCHENPGYGKPWASASNTPFRRHKHWTHEGGISTPLIAHWPAAMREGGKLNRAIGHITDIMPTLVEVAGAAYPAEVGGQAIPPPAGRSLVPLLRGGERADPELLCWEHEGSRAVREGRWKLVSAHDDGDRWELYDIEADRTENINLIDKEPDRARQMMARHAEWCAKVGALPYDTIKKGGGPPKPAA